MFDSRLLRAFVAIAETGSFTLAAGRLNMTQSTISQQLARLEDSAGRVLVDRTARPVQVTAAGERLLGYARRILALETEARAILGDPAGTNPIRIGLPEDIATPAMAALLRTFAAGRRELRLDITTGLSAELTRRYRSGEFDIVVIKEAAPEPDCTASFPEPMAWFECVDGPSDWADPMPLVAFPPGGLYRAAMFERIERERRNWYIAFSGSSLQNVLVGVEAGLGLSLLPLLATAGRHVQRYAAFDGEAPMAISLYAWERVGPLAGLAEQMVSLLATRSSLHA